MVAVGHMRAHEHFELKLVRLEPGQQWSPKPAWTSEGFAFVFPSCGSGSYHSGWGSVTVCPEDLLVIHPAPQGHLAPHEGRQLEARWFSVGMEQIFPLLCAREICHLQSVASGFKQGRLYRAASALAIACHQQLKDLPQRPSLDQRTRVLGIVAAVLADAFHEVARASGRFVRQGDHLYQVLEQLSVDDLLRLSVRDLAVRFGCSRRHLSRQFQHHFGCSVLALRTEMRLLRALSLLRDPQAKVIHVAERCGFGSLGFFNTLFRRRFGASPGKCRKSMQGPELSASRSIESDPACRLHAGGLCPWSGTGKRPVRWLTWSRGAAVASGLICLAAVAVTAADSPFAPGANHSASSTPAITCTSGTNLNAWDQAGAHEALDERQKLAVGDRLSFRVLEDREDPKSLTITDSGELDVPELGLVAAAGKTCKELALEIKSKLEQTTYFHATVIIGIELLNKTSSGRKVYVIGQVRHAGPQEIPAGETWTMSKAILRAGGFTEFADQKRVRLVRGAAEREPGKVLTANVREVWEHGRLDLDLLVQPDDLVYVPERAVRFY